MFRDYFVVVTAGWLCFGRGFGGLLWSKVLAQVWVPALLPIPTAWGRAAEPALPAALLGEQSQRAAEAVGGVRLGKTEGSHFLCSMTAGQAPGMSCVLHQTLASCSLSLGFQSTFLLRMGRKRGKGVVFQKHLEAVLCVYLLPACGEERGAPGETRIFKSSNKIRIFHVCLVCHWAGHACTSKSWRTGKYYFPVLGCWTTQILMALRYLSESNKELSDFPGKRLLHLFLSCQLVMMTIIFKENPLLGTEKGGGFQRLAAPQSCPWSSREPVQGAAIQAAQQKGSFVSCLQVVLRTPLPWDSLKEEPQQNLWKLVGW